MACGSGQLLADIVTGRKTDISTEGLSVDRYLGSAPTLQGRTAAGSVA